MASIVSLIQTLSQLLTILFVMVRKQMMFLARKTYVSCTKYIPRKTKYLSFRTTRKDCAVTFGSVLLMTIVTCLFIIKHGIDYRKVPYSKCSLTNSSEAYVYTERNTVFGKRRDFNQIVDATKVRSIQVKTSIAIGVAITSKNVFTKSSHDINSLVLFTTLLPSFCKTASEGYHYNFFIAYDQNDTFFNSPICSSHIHKQFHNFTVINCPTHNSDYSIHFVQCRHNGHPAKAQNDAMMSAYMSDMEYYYRINDDTTMITSGWTEAFISALQSFDPPNVGVVGPNHIGGLTNILTYEFVHYTHIEIFGFYYPRLFLDWFADGWITRVYSPNNMLKLQNVTLEHTLERGQRYYVDVTVYRKAVEESFLLNFRDIYLRYVGFKRANVGITQQTDQVISMSISGNHSRYYYGAIRNAQLRPLYFPDWTLRVYVVNNGSAENISEVPAHVINKLKKLDAQVIIVNSTKISARLAKYLVIDDKTVSRFLIRNPDQRISLRDSLLTTHWLKRQLNNMFCIHDVKNHSDKNIISGLFGAHNNPHFHKLLGGVRIRSLLEENTFDNCDDTFIKSFLWPKFKNETKCYDSSYQRGTSYKSIAFPPGLDSFRNVNLGTLYNEFEEIVLK